MFLTFFGIIFNINYNIANSLKELFLKLNYFHHENRESIKKSLKKKYMANISSTPEILSKLKIAKRNIFIIVIK